MNTGHLTPRQQFYDRNRLSEDFCALVGIRTQVSCAKPQRLNR